MGAAAGGGAGGSARGRRLVAGVPALAGLAGVHTEARGGDGQENGQEQEERNDEHGVPSFERLQ